MTDTEKRRNADPSAGRTPERIDAHQHFWRCDPSQHVWMTDAMELLRRDFLPAELAPLLAAGGFDGTIAVQARQMAEETDWLLQLADEHDFIRGVVGWVDLRALLSPLRHHEETISTIRCPVFFRDSFAHGLQAGRVNDN
jgi:predicted TIM-barrel fold metal-dependent hydrolase